MIYAMWCMSQNATGYSILEIWIFPWNHTYPFSNWHNWPIMVIVLWSHKRSLWRERKNSGKLEVLSFLIVIHNHMMTWKRKPHQKSSLLSFFNWIKRGLFCMVLFLVGCPFPSFFPPPNRKWMQLTNDHFLSLLCPLIVWVCSPSSLLCFSFRDIRLEREEGGDRGAFVWWWWGNGVHFFKEASGL